MLQLILLLSVLSQGLVEDFSWLLSEHDRAELQALEIQRLSSRDLQVRLVTEAQREQQREQQATRAYAVKLAELRKKTRCDKCNLVNGKWGVEK